MHKFIDFAKRNFLWLALGGAAALALGPNFAEVRTFLIIVALESLAVALSGAAAYAYTRIDFTKSYSMTNLGYVFLGVHVCVGLLVLGVYIAQI